MMISSRNLTLIIFLTLIISTTLLCYYILETLFSSFNISQQVEPYGKNIVTSDENILSNFTAELYPLFKSLDNIMASVIANKFNSDLYNMSSSLIDKTKLIDSGKKGIDDPYGLPKDVEQHKRKILDEIMKEFKDKNPGRELVYSFISTDDCGLYIMEPYSNQKNLGYGFYPNHPWCVELYDKKDRNSEYLTEFYYATTLSSKVSSVMFPLHSENGNTSFYVGGTMNMNNFTHNYFIHHNLDEWPKTQILLLVTNLDDGAKTLYDPLATATRGHGYSKGIYVNKFENNSFTDDDQKEIIKNVESFDNGNNGGIAKPVSTTNGTYLITATSNSLPNSYDIANPLQNHSHLIEWEWVLLRNIPDTQTTISNLTSVLDHNRLLDTLIVVSILVSFISIGATIILYKKIKRIGRGW